MVLRRSKRRSSSNDASSRKRPKNEAETPPFLRLPVELRLHIYGYLLHDVPLVPAVSDMCLAGNRLDISPIRTIEHIVNVGHCCHYHTIALRHDQAPCSVAIMRVNKQIYPETSDMLYNNIALEIEVSEDSLYFLRERNLHHTQLAYIFETEELASKMQTFRKLYITLLSEPKPTAVTHRLSGWNDNGRVFKQFVNWIAWHLKTKDAVRGPAKQVTISYRDEQLPMTQLEERLKWQSRPFQTVRGLNRAEVLHKAIVLESDDDESHVGSNSLPTATRNPIETSWMSVL